VTSTVVTLAPTGYAYTLLRVVDVLNYPSATCNPTAASWLLIYPPGNTVQTRIPYSGRVCSSATVFSGVQAVRSGNGS
jgi:hypothetical protein